VVVLVEFVVASTADIAVIAKAAREPVGAVAGV
jgi:hypothetical protein